MDLRKRFLSLDLSALPNAPDGPAWEELRRDIAQELKERELAAILTTCGDNLAPLFGNLYAFWSENWEEDEPLDLTKSLLGYLRSLAFAIDNHQPECLGRLTGSWFRLQVSVGDEPTYWMKRYMESLLSNEEFVADYRDIERLWPDGLTHFLNVAVPMWQSPILNPIMDAVLVPPEVVPESFVCNPDFLRKARKFVRRWNLEMVFPGSTKLLFVAARIHCASEVNGQGTYVFIPRYYKWTDIRNYADRDFRHLCDLIDKTYARFKSVGNVKGAKEQDLIAHVTEQLGDKKPTSFLVLKYTDEWIAEKGYKGHSQRTKYRNVARKAFNLPKST
jgi:hypothetical protein